MSTIASLPWPSPNPTPTNPPTTPTNPTTPTTPTSNVVIDSITWGTQLTDTAITVFFAPSGYSTPTGIGSITSDGFTGFEIAQFQKAFAAIEAVINVTFTIVNNPAQADLTLILDTNEVNGAILGLFNPPGEPNAGVGVFDASQWDREPDGDLVVGGFGYVTIVHELLHGLGLAHPHDDGGSSVVMNGVTGPFGSYGVGNLNQGIFTTMSYNSGYLTGPGGTAPSGTVGSRFGFEAGPMALDIAALQAIYGANTTHASGNSIYTLPTFNDQEIAWQSIWDTGGIDEIRHNGSDGAMIDLRAATLLYQEGGGGFASHVNDTPGGFTIANGVTIENGTGGSGRDEIMGNSANNLLLGRDGADTLRGWLGNDTLNGGNGSDLVIGNDGFDTLWGGNGDDTLSGELLADRLFGGNGDDKLDGGQGFDLLNGEDGNDTLYAGDDPDRLYGGTGDDLLYGGLNFSTTVDGLWGEAGDDTLFGEQGHDMLDGGAGEDVLDGGAQADNLYGRAGDDTLRGGQGYDRLVAGDGDDFARGGSEDDGIFGGAGNDKLNGESGNDRLFGETGDDTMDGSSGNDTLMGGAGFDKLTGNTGNDVLSGNFNADTFVFANGHGSDTITDFDALNDLEKIDLSRVSSITSMADLTANHMTQVGANVVIDTGGGNLDHAQQRQLGQPRQRRFHLLTQARLRDCETGSDTASLGDSLNCPQGALCVCTPIPFCDRRFGGCADHAAVGWDIGLQSTRRRVSYWCVRRSAAGTAQGAGRGLGAGRRRV